MSVDSHCGISLHGLAKENNVEEMIKLLTSRENINARDKLKRYY